MDVPLPTLSDALDSIGTRGDLEHMFKPSESIIYPELRCVLPNWIDHGAALSMLVLNNRSLYDGGAYLHMGTHISAN